MLAGGFPVAILAGFGSFYAPWLWLRHTLIVLAFTPLFLGMLLLQLWLAAWHLDWQLKRFRRARAR